MKILRVFPERTKYTPNDELVAIGEPRLLLIPEHDEVHISCVFTWDKEYCRNLQYQWEGVTNKPVRLGGPAFGSVAEDFVQGLYMKPNIIFTTRGCNNNCPWCIVPKIEGKLKELPICQGNIIQDNNFLQASRAHKEKVYEMLKTQKGICFKGGLDARLIDDHFIDVLQSLYYTYKTGRKVSRIKELWLACDSDAEIPVAVKAIKKLEQAGFNRKKIHCYCLIGDNMDKNEARLRRIHEAGAMPFAMLYRDFGETKTEYSDEWNAFARQWLRPAVIKAHMENGTDFRDYHT